MSCHIVVVNLHVNSNRSPSYLDLASDLQIPTDGHAVDISPSHAVLQYIWTSTSSYFAVVSLQRQSASSLVVVFLWIFYSCLCRVHDMVTQWVQLWNCPGKILFLCCRSVTALPHFVSTGQRLHEEKKPSPSRIFFSSRLFKASTYQLSGKWEQQVLRADKLFQTGEKPRTVFYIKVNSEKRGLRIIYKWTNVGNRQVEHFTPLITHFMWPNTSNPPNDPLKYLFVLLMFFNSHKIPAIFQNTNARWPGHFVLNRSPTK